MIRETDPGRRIIAVRDGIIRFVSSLGVSWLNYRVQSPVFSFVVPQHGLIGPGLHTPAVSDGIWLLLRPLEPGMHVLHVRAVVPTVNGDFVVDVTYNLTVVREE